MEAHCVDRLPRTHCRDLLNSQQGTTKTHCRRQTNSGDPPNPVSGSHIKEENQSDLRKKLRKFIGEKINAFEPSRECAGTFRIGSDSSRNILLYSHQETNIPWEEESKTLERGQMLKTILSFIKFMWLLFHERHKSDFSKSRGAEKLLLRTSRGHYLSNSNFRICDSLQKWETGKQSSVSPCTPLVLINRLEEYAKKEIIVTKNLLACCRCIWDSTLLSCLVHLLRGY